jgi:hypothetical protein
VKKYFAILVIVAFAIVNLFSQELLTGGILTGPTWACIVKAPDGWSMDQTSLAKYSIYGLFYENGKKFGGSTPIIYINTQKLNNETDEELSKFIKWDLDNYRSQGAIIQKQEKKYDHFSNQNETYTIDTKNKQYEIVVYTRFKNCAFLIILTTKDPESRDQLHTKLDEVIANIRFIDRK